MKKITKKFPTALILAVDDYPLNHEILSSLLKPAGCKVIKAENGKDALLKYQSTPNIDLIIMDVMMPEMDGYQATQEIRKIEVLTNKHVPIIGLTANAEAADREKCISAGMDNYITKPIKSESIEQMLVTYLAHKIQEDPSPAAASPVDKNVTPATAEQVKVLPLNLELTGTHAPASEPAPNVPPPAAAKLEQTSKGSFSPSKSAPVSPAISKRKKGLYGWGKEK